ncbi:hypothetical protein FNV43_RR20299 [Rhamnella rubrinervis]|uniref:Leucine-rich repeat-containing N-terminal plant-type domain-containing protein n=1 Tax=Rhamnella rubrinervis TaxID=2594499 RepID=A0A8K0GWX6_9ROSA|nr:hypothetical protein FNV43_RR20299 [Rhamnella rubrinervis]
MRRLTRQIVVHSLLLVYLVDGVVGSNSTGVGDLKTRCRDGERQALLKFKDNLDDDHDVLPSWNNKEENRECCNWCGIGATTWCNLQGLIPESVGNLIALDYLDLSHNKLEGEIPKSIWNICTLKILNVSSNKLSGQFSEPNERSCGQYSLEHLDVSRNSIMGSFPNLTLFPSLKTLSLSSNQLNGSVHQRIGQLSELEYLDISNNSLEGVISEAHFAKLSKLRFLDLSFNQLHLNVSSAWIPPFKLEEIRLSSCKLGPQFPEWLQTQNNYIHLDISNTKISDPIPSWFWNLATNSTFLNVSNNQIRGAIANSTVEWNYYKEEIDLSSNQLEGPVCRRITIVLKNCTELEVLDVGENKLWGSIPTWIGERLENLVVLSLRSNHFNGSIPVNLCHLQHLQLLDLSINDVSGSMPKCVGNFSAMRERSNENTSTTIEYDYVNPSTPSTQNGFSYTHAVQGHRCIMQHAEREIPREITELIGLVSLNLSRNNLSGQIPSDIGHLTSLDFLDLSNNHFLGKIPQSLTQIDRLSMLNFSNNNLSGEIPTGNQLQTFGVDSYMGNPGLCGDPLHKKCRGEETNNSEPTERAGDEEVDDEFIAQGFFISMGVGFAVAFWGFVGHCS